VTSIQVAQGYGMNWQAFAFHYPLPVDSAGTLPDGDPFKDVRELKKLLLHDEMPITRNLVMSGKIGARATRFNSSG
jgi:hypothetical protein